MAGSAVTELKVKVGVTGDKNLTRLSRSLSNLGRDTAKANFNFKRFSAVLQEKEKRAVKSVNTTRQFSAAWRELANSVRIGSNEFKIATAEAARLDAQLAKAQARKGMSLGGMARGAGAVAAAGVFGGPEGAVGAGIGAVMGGPVGAAVGGAIGAQVGMVRQAIGSTAEYSAALARQRKALRLVIGDTNAYAKSQTFLEQKSKKLAIPQDVIVRQFTALTASVKGAGHSVEDAQKVFESIASGIRGTGGSLEDMRAAMVATAQVFSKGKVSAEELRQQLGERLPGAFTIFAESMGKTPAELDKALEQGQVTLNDFMKFSETLFKKYGKNAEILAAGPEAAGDRLTTAMSEFKDNVGQLLQPIGAAFQDTFTDIINAINPAIKAFVEFRNKTKIASLEAELSKLQEALKTGTKYIGSEHGLLGSLPVQVDKNWEGVPYKTESMQIQEQIELLKDKLNVLKGIKDEQKDLEEGTNNLGQTSVKVWENMKGGAQKYLDSIKDVATQIQDAMQNAFKGMEDALVDFVMTGKFKFREFALSVLRDITRIIVRQSIMMPMLGALGIKPSAKGNVFAQNGIVPFARGGIINKPTIFPFKNGIGLMGEAGPEAIMPLRRGPSGRLGVESAGGGVGSINVNVDASGSSVEGDQDQGRELGRLIGASIQAELIRQKRPGGLLT